MAAPSYTTSVSCQVSVTGTNSNGYAVNRTLVPFAPVQDKTSPGRAISIAIQNNAQLNVTASTGPIFADIDFCTMLAIIPDGVLTLKGVNGDSTSFSLSGAMPLILPWAAGQSILLVNNNTGAAINVTLYLL